MSEPKLRDGDVLVRVRAADVNPLDSKIWDGEFRLGHDVAGVVTRVGPDVRNFTVGDEITRDPARTHWDVRGAHRA